MSDDNALHREMEAAKLLREQLAALGHEDEDLAADAIEGETNLHEAICALSARIGEDEAQVKGIKAYAEDILTRRQRIEKRIEARRGLIALAMEVAGKKKIETPSGTISLKPVPPKVIVFDEVQIPTRFWKPADPTLDRKALKEALDAGEPIAGAELSNGSITISIRRS